MPRRLTPVAPLVALLFAACGGGHAAVSASGSSTTTASSTASSIGPLTSVTTAAPDTSTPAVSSTAPSTTAGSHAGTTSVPATAAPAQHAYTLSESDNGRTLSVHRGDTLTVILHSTYWAIQPSSNPAVVEAQGSPTVAPQMQGCVAGQGCGTVTQPYRAVGTGQAQLSAHRDSCGEAMRCTPAQSDWRVTVTVTA